MRRIPSIRVGLALGASALAGLALPSAASAAPSCAASGRDVVCTFSDTGAAQTWTVPEGVSEATFEVSGAAGADLRLQSSTGGRGGRATATIAVTPGDTLQVNVGRAGYYSSGGFNGGAHGMSGATGFGGGGGGASDVRSGAYTLADRIIVGGGGGGAGYYYYGGAGGGTTGGAQPAGGGGGSQTAGGAGAPVQNRTGLFRDGRPGTFGAGGAGGECARDICAGGGGGGGGGWYGGGGGSETGGGGGGSGFGPAGVVFASGVQSGDGTVRITYTPPVTDTTAPTTTVQLDPSAANGSGGWYVSTVKATVSATDGDGGSGVAETRCALDPPTVPVLFADLPTGCAYTGTGAVISSDGSHTLDVASRDGADNAERPVARTFKIDRTAPTVTCTTPAPSFTLNQSGRSVTATVTDATSGAAQSTISAAADARAVGVRAVSMTGADVAGNQTTTTCSYAVTYAFAGFFAPVENRDANGVPVLNEVRSGRAIPLKWRLTDAAGAPVTGLARAEITLVDIPCPSGGQVDPVEESADSGSGLQHLGDGNYQINWKSQSGYANTCKRLRLDLLEGSTAKPTYHTVDFKFTK